MRVGVEGVDGGDVVGDDAGEQGSGHGLCSFRGGGRLSRLHQASGVPSREVSRPGTAVVSPLGGDLILGVCRPSLAIGDFSRATHLSIKTLRHYHRIGLLEPAESIPTPGTAATAPTRSPPPRSSAVPGPRHAPGRDPCRHRRPGPGRPQRADRRPPAAPGDDPGPHPAGRRVAARPARTPSRRGTRADRAPPDAATPAAAVSDVIDVSDASGLVPGRAWRAVRPARRPEATPAGPAGAIYANDLFSHERGEATVFVPCEGRYGPPGG